MRERALGACIALGIGLTALAPARAHALSCDGRLVEVGDSEAYVRSVCGEPTTIMTRMETRAAVMPYGYYPYGHPGYGYVPYGYATTTVQVDVLVYDFGPTRFIDELTFENGVLRADRIAGYGTVAAAHARREARRAERERARHRDDE